MHELTQQRLKELFRYEPSTGKFFRLSGRYAGKQVGFKKTNGYIHIRIDGKGYPAHRLALLYMHGITKFEDVDHINGIRDDNRIENLRNVSRSINLQNKRKPHSNNSTGFLGVTRHKGQFCARITLDGKSTWLGTFKTPQEAGDAYFRAKRSIHKGAVF